MRLKGHDYTDAGYYFITTVTADRMPFFGRIESGTMNLSGPGFIALEELNKTGELRDYIIIDEFVIMPDHVHLILVINESNHSSRRCVARYAPTENIARCSLVARYEATGEYFSSISPGPKSVSAIVRAYKSAVTKRCHESGIHDFSWQRGFYDHIVRDQQELDAIRRYIRCNPERW